MPTTRKDHPDPGQGLAGEGVFGQVRVDDRIGRRRHLARQMVIGDQHRPAARFGCGDASVTGDAVIDGDQHIRLQPRQFVDQRRRQAIAMHHAIGHGVVHIQRTEHAQAAHTDGTGGGTIAVEIAHHQNAPLLRDRVGQ